MRFARKRRLVEGSAVGAVAEPVHVCITCGAWQVDMMQRPIKPEFFCVRHPDCNGTEYHKFDSKTEARQYANLKLRESRGLIKDIQLQPKFPLHAFTPDGRKVLVWTYYADFAFTEIPSDRRVIQDVKGSVDTRISQVKRKHAGIEYGVEIEVVSP